MDGALTKATEWPPGTLRERFCRRVREELHARGWSQTQFAHRLGKSPQFVSNYLKNRQCPGLALVGEFAEALGMADPADLLKERT